MRSKKIFVLIMVVSFVVSLWACESAFAGYIVCWGDNIAGQSNPPVGSDFVAISSGWRHNLALKENGSLVAWGANYFGVGVVPLGSDFTAISSGAHYNLAIRSDGSLVAWGRNNAGQCNVPSGNNFVVIDGGGDHSIALANEPNTVVYSFYDDFNDGVIGDSWQVSTANGGSVEEVNGYLKEITGDGVRYSNATLVSNFEIEGDFDVQVDFDLIVLDEYWSAAGLDAYLDASNVMSVSVTYAGGRKYESDYWRNGVHHPEGYVYTNPMAIDSGKLRLTRSGSEITSYYWTGSDWTALMTRNVFDGPAKFKIAVGNGVYGSAPYIEVHWDNFSAEPALLCHTCKGDLNGDNWVMVSDLTLLIGLLGVAGPPYAVPIDNPQWSNPCADMDGNEWIMLSDMFALIAKLGQAGPPYIIPCP